MNIFSTLFSITFVCIECFFIAGRALILLLSLISWVKRDKIKVLIRFNNKLVCGQKANHMPIISMIHLFQKTIRILANNACRWLLELISTNITNKPHILGRWLIAESMT